MSFGVYKMNCSISFYDKMMFIGKYGNLELVSIDYIFVYKINMYNF